MSNKIYGSIVFILFLGIWFSGYPQSAQASDGISYISNRVKIIRPEKMDPGIAPEKDISSSAAPADDPKPAIAAKEPEKPIVEPDSALPGSASAPDRPEEMTEEMMREEIANIIGRKERFYSRKGRIDPFEPFLRQPEPDVTSEEQAQIERRVPRTPLEKIDLSQLSLTAVLRMPSKIQALVQDSSGKGYVVNEGTYVGNKGGQISKIFKDRIVVEEKFLDVFGKVSVRERELKLQQ